MLPRSDPGKRIHPDCPPALADYVRVTIAVNTARKPFYRGETLIDLVKRECPSIFDEVRTQGFDLRLDLPENSHTALAKGRIAYQIRKRQAH